jgi:ABC-2 type transport system permease protein
MNRKQIFSFRLYKDAIRQLRIIGLTATVLLTLEAVIIPIGYYLSYKSNLKYNMNYSASIVSFMEVHPLVVLSFIILAPLLTLYLFSFLNKRNSSDFYHSIPHSRTCLFLSYFSSIVTWIIIVMGISSIVSLIMSEALRESFILNMATVPLTLFNIFAGSLFVAACIAVAMCITGTTFNNIIVSGMIIFVQIGRASCRERV